LVSVSEPRGHGRAQRPPLLPLQAAVSSESQMNASLSFEIDCSPTGSLGDPVAPRRSAGRDAITTFRQPIQSEDERWDVRTNRLGFTEYLSSASTSVADSVETSFEDDHQWPDHWLDV